jgi:hypothetical protein
VTSVLKKEKRTTLPQSDSKRYALPRGLLKKARVGFILISFILAPLVRLFSAGIQCEWTGVEKIIAIGDLHGDYQNFVKILLGTQIVDGNLHWIAGKTHLVQMGDILDRGTDAKGIFDLLMRLEKEAANAGGMVHTIIGNHEEMNVTGIVFRYPDYMTIHQFTSFLPDAYRRKQERVLGKRIKDLEARGQGQQRENLVSEFWNKLKEDPEAQKQYLVHFNEIYGTWILKQNAVIKINDIVFVHGGINEKYSHWTIEDINNRLRLELSELAKAAEGVEPAKIGQLEIAYKGDSPLWYRDLAAVPEADLKDEVDRILANLGAKVMVIAHTPRIPSIREMRRFGGKIWIIDTGISRVYGGRLSALIIQNGDFVIWGERNEKTDQPDYSPSASRLLWPVFLRNVPVS